MNVDRSSISQIYHSKGRVLDWQTEGDYLSQNFQEEMWCDSCFCYPLLRVQTRSLKASYELGRLADNQCGLTPGG